MLGSVKGGSAVDAVQLPQTPDKHKLGIARQYSHNKRCKCCERLRETLKAEKKLRICRVRRSKT